jgi:hypothetical protein
MSRLGRRSGRLGRGVLTALGVALLGACATSGYTYVANDDLGAYFRVPDTYQVYDNDEVMEPLLADVSEDVAAAVREQQWVVAFDANEEPAVDRFVAQITDPSEAVAGYARVRTLGQEERLSYSLQSLRNELIPADQAAALGERLEVLNVEEVSQDGARGLKLTFSVQVSDGTLVFDQMSLVDDATSRVYLLALGCSSACYDASRDDIAAITESWTIEER